MNKNFLVLLFFILFFSILNISPMPWDESIDDTIIDLQHKIRGDRFLNDDFILVYISDSDLKNLGGWPLSRDYYSYLIHILKPAGAQVIAFDMLFSNSDFRHPEYDKTFSDFIESAGNVCLPMIFSEVIPHNEISNNNNQDYYGVNPTLPLKQFADHAAAIGFSNFSKLRNMLRIPLAASSGDSTFYSFGAQMAHIFLNKPLAKNAERENRRQLIPDDSETIQLNHFGDINNIQSINFVDLLKKFQNTPDSLNFEGKLVLVTVTAPGVSAVKRTPLSATLPSSLIHLTVAENLINKNYLTTASMPVQISILVLALFGVYLALQLKTDKSFIFFCSGLLVIFWLISILAFSLQELIIPVFYPTLALVSAFFYYLLNRFNQKRILQSSISELFQNQIIIKENQLQDVRDHLNKQLASTEEISDLAEQRKSEILKLEKEINDLKIYSSPKNKTSEVINSFKDIIYSANSPLAQVLEMVLKVSPNDIPVLILGETGTGKEMIAREIHKNSSRKNFPFVAVNCGALSETLLESELFGHEKGSFTGAATMRRGRFELADGGSIFLDEISETSAAFQAKLLRVLQESTFERIGAERSIKTDVRIIAATNKNLQDEVEKSFRADLFYRLNGFPIELPALRQRKEDLPLLVQHFLKKHAFDLEISDQAINILKKYPWPGNIRELENHVRRAAIIVKSENRTLIQQNDFSDEILKEGSNISKNTIHKPLEEQILETMRSLKFSHSSISQTAKILGNRDRGTITEYFRGICFEHLVNANFNIDDAVRSIAAEDDEQVLNLLKNKINAYMQNLDRDNPDKSASSYKGLPKKYHIFLEKVLDHINLH